MSWSGVFRARFWPPPLSLGSTTQAQDPALATLTHGAGVSVFLTGVQGTGQVGTPTVTGFANVTLTGIAGTGAAGTPTVSGAANVTLTGVS